MQAPTQNAISQGKHGTYNAVDYRSVPDANIYAPEDGRVVSYAYNGDCGNNMQIDGATGRHGFCHLERATVSVGQQVKKGQVVGIMGYTGLTIPKGAGGRHLHWVLRRGNTYVYPPDYINEPFNQPSGGGNNMFQNDNEIIEAYQGVLNRTPNASEIAGWRGQSKQRFFQVAKAEVQSIHKQLADVKTALKNEQAKPPKEVVKIVEKIVEKPVEKIVIKEVGEDEAVKGWFSRLIDKIMIFNKKG